MVNISLEISATLDQVEELYTNHPDYTFLLKVKCLNCGECTDKWHDVIESKGYPCKNGKTNVHFLAKCKLCGRENTLSILEGTNGIYHNQDQGKFKSIVTFACRGIEPFEFTPTIGWIVKVADSGTIYKDVNLTENEWVDYDDTISKCVGIYDFKSQFVKVK
ncbi:hypothetical protein WA026_009578 [Henosepilachna vigintioctopunctata]|uniref:CXXC motif containing zinc binding protein n=1 Tax=Henosepilachna vigintioctopunctata TaxID=420089 RepID=A0AAW1TW34_9CUCU